MPRLLDPSGLSEPRLVDPDLAHRLAAPRAEHRGRQPLVRQPRSLSENVTENEGPRPTFPTTLMLHGVPSRMPLVHLMEIFERLGVADAIDEFTTVTAAFFLLHRL